MCVFETNNLRYLIALIQVLSVDGNICAVDICLLGTATESLGTVGAVSDTIGCLIKIDTMKQ